MLLLPYDGLSRCWWGSRGGIRRGWSACWGGVATRGGGVGSDKELRKEPALLQGHYLL